MKRDAGRTDMDKECVASDETGAESPDRVAVEEPLQITVDGVPVAVTMRTPGHDGELAAGFLLTEGVVSAWSDIRRVEAEGNRVLVFLADGVEVDFGRLTRHVFSASSCGLCGKAAIEAIASSRPPLASGAVFPPEALLAAPDKLAAEQDAFSRTGGMHAAGLFAADGTMLVVREDVGRHNAVDKVLGRAMAEGLLGDDRFLLVSGRVSFEIMQKALAGGIPLVAAISAPSSLAVEFAKESNQALVGFLRPPGFKVYAGAERLARR